MAVASMNMILYFTKTSVHDQWEIKILVFAHSELSHGHKILALIIMRLSQEVCISFVLMPKNTN